MSPGVEGMEGESGSRKLQPTKSQPRFKQEPPKFTTLAQGRDSLLNRITIPLKDKAVIGPHLGTFLPDERNRATFSSRESVKEKEQQVMQARQQAHEAQEIETEKTKDQQRIREVEMHMRQLQFPPQREEQQSTQYNTHTPHLVPDSLRTSLLGQQASSVQADTIDFKMDEKARNYLEAQKQAAQQQAQHAAQQQAQHFDQPPQQAQPFIQEQPPATQQKSGGTTSSYWSVPEQHDFYNYLRYFGTDWQAIAKTMKTKTHVMIKNFYHRKIQEGEAGKQLEEEATRADKLRTEGADMGPLPAPTQVGESDAISTA